MSDKIAIKVQNLSKMYKLYNNTIDRLKESINPFKSKYHKDFYALEGIDIEIKKGETLGIVGRNGSGKSTLLKIITGVLTPTQGKVEVEGKVAAILELGAGFNPELTGYENVYLNGTIIGYNKKQIDSKIGEVLSFADIGTFINQPVKTYSSGMFARLAFATAVNFEPEILIVDEVLAVGDIRFQIKCIEKMESMKSSGTTILFVSHSTEQVRRFCTKALWLEQSKIKMFGEAVFVTDQYEDFMKASLIQREEINNQGIEIDYNSQSIENKNGLVAEILKVSSDKYSFKTFGELEVIVEYYVYDDTVDNFLIGVAIYGQGRRYIFGPNTYLDNASIPNKKGHHIIKYKIPNITLLSGTYFIDVGMFKNKGLVYLDYKTEAIKFEISNNYFTEGLVYIKHDWEVIK